MSRGARLIADDAELLARELVRAWRGERTQLEASVAIGFRSNVYSAWERGVAWPTASRAMAAAREGGCVLRELGVLFGSDWGDRVPLDSREGVALLIGDAVGAESLRDFARRIDLSRHSLSRYLNAQAEPSFPDFLKILGGSGRLVDALHIFADFEDLPSFSHEWVKHLALVDIHATAIQNTEVLIALYLDAYQALPCHEPGWLARCLGLSLEEEVHALSTLKHAGLIELVEGRYQCLPVDVQVSFDGTPEDDARRKRWLQRQLFIGKRMHEAHTFALVSRAEARQIKSILHAATQQILRIAANTDSTEVMLKLNTHLSELCVDEP